MGRLAQTLGLANKHFVTFRDSDIETSQLKQTKNMKLLLALASILLSIGVAGCGAVAEVAYDDAIQRERAQCEKLVSMSDRQTCMQRVNTAKRQADEQRKK